MERRGEKRNGEEERRREESHSMNESIDRTHARIFDLIDAWNLKIRNLGIELELEFFFLSNP